MNRFTRNNLLLIVIIGCACIAAAGLLVFSIIRYVGMTTCLQEIDRISKQVKALAAKKPRPHKDNREPITANRDLYNSVADKLAVYFKSDMTALAEEFIKGLQETNPPKEDDKVVPLTVERFKRDYEEMWNKGQNYVSKQYNYREFRDLRFKNWNQVVRAILPKAQKLTTEPLDENNLPEVLFTYIGIPRTMGEQPANMVKFMTTYQNALVNLMTGIKFNIGNQRVDWFGFDIEPTEEQISKRFTSPREQYPSVARVWDIYGDVLKRMVGCTKKVVYQKDGKSVVEPATTEVLASLQGHNIPYREIDDRIDSFNGLTLRATLGSNAGSGNPDNQNASGALAGAVNGDEEGPFKVYRMRIEIGGSIAGVRTFVKALEDAYLEKHVYVIKSIALYAEQDGAYEILNRDSNASGVSSSVGSRRNDANANDSSASRGRGRRHNRAPEAEEARPEKSKAELAREEEARRMQEEAAKKLKFYERRGYGDVLIGNDKNCRAVIDFDCYEMK